MIFSWCKVLFFSNFARDDLWREFDNFNKVDTFFYNKCFCVYVLFALFTNKVKIFLLIQNSKKVSTFIINILLEISLSTKLPKCPSICASIYLPVRLKCFVRVWFFQLLFKCLWYITYLLYLSVCQGTKCKCMYIIVWWFYLL